MADPDVQLIVVVAAPASDEPAPRRLLVPLAVFRPSASVCPAPAVWAVVLFWP